MSPFVCLCRLEGGPVDFSLLERMVLACEFDLKTQAHVRVDHGIGLARRGESDGLWVGSENGCDSQRYWLAADAHLHNREELAQRLGLESPCPAGRLILAAYLKWGRACCSKLLGDFAFAVWDRQEKTLFAARDVLGVKTLHFFQKYPWLGVATRARQILAHPEVSEALSRRALLTWSLNGYDEELSMFEEVQALPPGHWLNISPRGLTRGAYWDVNSISPIRYADPKDYAFHLEELLARCVADRCRDEQDPVGTMLSGGMDSSSVTALAARALGAGRRPMVFSFRFSTLKDCDESSYSQSAGDFLGLPIRWLDNERFWLLKGAFEEKARRENPLYCWDSLDLSMLGTLAGAGGRVLLTGHGGDSLMTGLQPGLLAGAALWRGEWGCWPRFLAAIREENLTLAAGLLKYVLAPKMPASWKAAKRRFGGEALRRYPWVSSRTLARFPEAIRFFYHSPRYFREPDRSMTYRYIIPFSAGVRRAVHWYERLAEPFGIQVRHPFLDRRLAEFVLAIPQAVCRGPGWPKGLLRNALKGYLPEIVLWRKDKPSLASYYFYGLKNEYAHIKYLIKNSVLADMELIDKQVLVDAFEQYIHSSPGETVAHFFSTILTELWLQKERGLLM